MGEFAFTLGQVSARVTDEAPTPRAGRSSSTLNPLIMALGRRSFRDWSELAGVAGNGLRSCSAHSVKRVLIE